MLFFLLPAHQVRYLLQVQIELSELVIIRILLFQTARLSLFLFLKILCRLSSSNDIFTALSALQATLNTLLPVPNKFLFESLLLNLEENGVLN